MANKEHLQLLLAAVASDDLGSWNQWRKKNPDLKPDLREADLSNASLCTANLSDANLSGAILTDADLRWANLNGANLTSADLRGANLSDANLKCAHSMRADLTGANLTGADLRFADLRGATLENARLSDTRLSPTQLRGTISSEIKLVEVRGEVLASSPADAALLKQLKGRAGRLAKAALGLFQRKEEVVTLGLSQHRGGKEGQPEALSAGPPGSGKP